MIQYHNLDNYYFSIRRLRYAKSQFSIFNITNNHTFFLYSKNAGGESRHAKQTQIRVLTQKTLGKHKQSKVLQLHFLNSGTDKILKFVTFEDFDIVIQSEDEPADAIEVADFSIQYPTVLPLTRQILSR